MLYVLTDKELTYMSLLYSLRIYVQANVWRGRTYGVGLSLTVE